MPENSKFNVDALIVKWFTIERAEAIDADAKRALNAQLE